MGLAGAKGCGWTGLAGLRTLLLALARLLALVDEAVHLGDERILAHVGPVGTLAEVTGADNGVADDGNASDDLIDGLGAAHGVGDALQEGLGLEDDEVGTVLLDAFSSKTLHVISLRYGSNLDGCISSNSFHEVLLVSGSSGFNSTSATSSGYNLAFLSRYSVTGIFFCDSLILYIFAHGFHQFPCTDRFLKPCFHSIFFSMKLIVCI